MSHCTCHNPLHCYLPPYIIERLAECEHPDMRQLARDAIAADAAARTLRTTMASLPTMGIVPSPTASKNRLIYDMDNRQNQFALPGRLVRAEGDAPVTDGAANEAYDNSGIVYDFYQDVFSRNSLDNNGMTLVSSVHFGSQYNNAFFNGQQMAYGDGDGQIFLRFTQALDVVGHELTHGVVAQESALVYQDQSGALNESFADVMGALVEHWQRRTTADQADWMIGNNIMGPGTSAQSLRTFLAERAYENDALLGTDPQPKHMQDLYTGQDDNGGVHINSGIPNHAFYRLALELGGFAWEKAGRIWYQTLRNLNRNSDFQEAATMTYVVAGSLFGAGSLEQQAVQRSWDVVGLAVN